MKKIGLVILFIFTSVFSYGQKKNIVILATGGTIAGSGTSSTSTSYKAGAVTVDKLIAAVPQILDMADIKGEQVASIGSQDMSDDVWMTLSKRINELLEKKDVDGIVITHGTDTMEETAFFLSLTVKSIKPVVLVGSMRASTALSADGPMNLYNAVVVATNKNTKGVVVSMNDIVLSPSDVTKTNTVSVQTFNSPNFGVLGYVSNGNVNYRNDYLNNNMSDKLFFDITNVKELPRVEIVYSYSNVSDVAVKAIIDAKVAGIVHAGVGNGNIHKNVFPHLIDASKKGIKVVRSSRVFSGATTLDAEVEDDKYGFIASGTLNPQKARVMLMLSLLKSNNYKEIQKNFINN